MRAVCLVAALGLAACDGGAGCARQASRITTELDTDPTSRTTTTSATVASSQPMPAPPAAPPSRSGLGSDDESSPPLVSQMTQDDPTLPNGVSGPGYSVIYRDYGPNPAAAPPRAAAPQASAATGEAAPAPEAPTSPASDLVFLPYGREVPRAGEERLEPRPVAPTPPLNGGPAHEPTPIPPRPGIPIYPQPTRPPTTTH